MSIEVREGLTEEASLRWQRMTGFREDDPRRKGSGLMSYSLTYRKYLKHVSSSIICMSRGSRYITCQVVKSRSNFNVKSKDGW